MTKAVLAREVFGDSSATIAGVMASEAKPSSREAGRAAKNGRIVAVFRQASAGWTRERPGRSEHRVPGWHGALTPTRSAAVAGCGFFTFSTTSTPI